MHKNQKIGFWSIFIGFCLIATLSMYRQGAFEYTGTLGGAAILVASYLCVAWCIHHYVRQNPDDFD